MYVVFMEKLLNRHFVHRTSYLVTFLKTQGFNDDSAASTERIS